MNKISKNPKSERSFIFILLATVFLSFALSNSVSAQVTFNNFTPITILDSGSPPTPADPYPSNITVAGLTTGAITKVTVSLFGFNHAFPDDVDMLLVSPNGTNFVFFADVGGGTPANTLDFTLEDAGTSLLPDNGPLVSGTFKPTNVDITDSFPGPTVVHPADDAAPGGTATFASKFNGMQSDLVNGNWQLYVVDDEFGGEGSLAGGWSISFSGVSATPAPLIISEFRFRGPASSTDEFVEIYNNSDEPVTIITTDASAGFALVASDGVIRFVLPNGLVIPARGHFLATNSGGYSLDGYAAGNETYLPDIGINAGIALFKTANPANFNLGNRLDAVGSTSIPNILYKEGSGYSPITAFSIDYSFFRKENVGTCSASTVDTNDNAADFLFVDTNGTSNGAGQRLGAPGPQNLASQLRPFSFSSTGFAEGRVDSGAAFSGSPNLVRDTTSDPADNATFGKLSIRRKFTNNTSSSMTSLRFRVTDITTLPAPSGQADLRAISSAKIAALPVTGGGTVVVNGTTLQQPPSQTKGGGYNSSFSVNTVSAGSPLAPGASVNVQFVFGIQQTGRFNIALNIESLPVGDKNQAFIYRGFIKDAAQPNPAQIVPFTQPCSLVPTAASVTVGGRVMTSLGRGIRNVRVTMIDGGGNVRTAITGAFGYYRFEDVAAGETYVITATGKRFKFEQSSQVLNVEEETIDVNFIGVGSSKS